jgi:hypothetical protein
VDEVAPLAAVLEHARGAAGGEGGAEDAGHPGVRRVARHPRAVHVVVAQRGHGHARLVAVRRAQVLLRQLRRRVDAARVERRVLGHRLRRERAPAARAGRLEAAGVEVGGPARRRSDDAVLGARVAALAVDDHARGEHEPARESAPGERPQQLGGRQVVVRHVGGQVVQVDAEAHHRGLVRDVVDAVGDALGDRGVAQVALDPLGRRVEVVRPRAVRRGQQRVDRADGVPGGEQLVDDVRADEPGAAGHEDHGPRSVVAGGTRPAACNPLVASRA